jgi:murein DD-endopeptidase MepM/ murein hydrolase activator NlpD
MKRNFQGLVKTAIIVLFLALLPLQGFGQTWVKLSPIGEPPAARNDTVVAVYDPSSNRLITFGGITYCCTNFNDVWVLTNANGSDGVPEWIKLNPASPQGFPAPRGRHSAVYDTGANRMIIFGGGNFTGDPSCNFCIFNPLFNDVWVLTNANGLGGTPTWVPLFPSGGPPAGRAGHHAVYDPASNRMTIFGGGNNGIMVVPNDVWVLTNANGLGGNPTWVQLDPTGQIPPPVEAFAIGYDNANNIMTIFGGCCSFTNSTYTLTNANGIGGMPQWTQLTIPDPLPSIRGTLLYGYNPSQNSAVIFGEGAFGGVVHDTWVLTNANGIGAANWVNTIPDGALGTPPVPDTMVGGTYDVADDRLILVRSGPETPAAIGIEVWVLANSSAAPRFLTFPLHGETASSATISTVMDHHIAKDADGNPLFYASDNFVDAYTGEEGALNCAPATSPCSALDKEGNQQSPAGYKNTQDKLFTVNGHYTGGRPCYNDDGKKVPCQSWLFYEGHPGFDFPAQLGTAVYAPARGVAFIPDCDPVTRKADCTDTPSGGAVDGFNILTIDHGNGYSTWYLHMGDLEKTNNELATIPPEPFQISVAHSVFQADRGVVYALNPKKTLKKVASNPSRGHYSVNANGIYTFSSADSGLGVLISYYYAIDLRVISCPNQPSVALKRGDHQRVFVTPDCIVGEVGNKAIDLKNNPLPLGAHLHFEVRKGLVATPTGIYQCALPSCVPVDPYGWRSTTQKDPYPYPFGPNIVLWSDPEL